MKIAPASHRIASLVAVVGLTLGAVLGGCASADGSEDSAEGPADETPPATTAEELRAACHWVRRPGPCPIASPGGGATALCYPAVIGYAHWSRICGGGGGHACPAGEVWTGSGCIPSF